MLESGVRWESPVNYYYRRLASIVDILNRSRFGKKSYVENFTQADDLCDVYSLFAKTFTVHQENNLQSDSIFLTTDSQEFKSNFCGIPFGLWLLWPIRCLSSIISWQHTTQKTNLKTNQLTKHSKTRINKQTNTKEPKTKPLRLDHVSLYLAKLSASSIKPLLSDGLSTLKTKIQEKSVKLESHVG